MSSKVRLTEDGPLSPFQGRSSSVSSFHASLLNAINGVMSLALCPQVVSQAPQHCLVISFIPACPGQHTQVSKVVVDH